MSTWDEVEHLLVHGRDGEAAQLAVRHLQDESHPLANNGGARMDPLDQLDELAPVLAAVIGAIRDDQLDNATPCTEFTVTGVLDHMVGGATMFAAAFTGEVPGPIPDGDRRAATGEALGKLVAAMHSPGALDRTVAAPFGEVPGTTFAQFVVLDGLVHGWDMASATGQIYAPPDALVTQVAAFARDAVPPLRGTAFGPEADPPTDATPIERLAAFTGRAVTAA